MNAIVGQLLGGKVGEAYFAICELGCALGVRDLKALPGCWEQQVDQEFWFALNGHNEPRACSHQGLVVQTKRALIVSRGMACGELGLTSGAMLPGYEDRFILACHGLRDAVDAGSAVA